jgi:type I restriction enzyme M protein
VKLQTIKSLDDLLGIVQTHSNVSVIYRGVSSAKYKLIPKVGRRRHGGKLLAAKDERYILRLFRQRAIAHLDRTPADDWEWLAIAQHDGLPTRLLYWTRNPLVAAYFAVVDESSDDSALYACRSNSYIQIEKHRDPFEIDHVARVIPNHATIRIAVQSGLFTIHPRPSEPFMSPDVERFVIPNEQRRAVKKALSKVGVDRASLFPDLDAIARHVDWLRTDEY